MELIPILSLIVLVATISTFILAVGAYVLYKVRERKGRRAAVPMQQAAEAELYAPQARYAQPEISAQQRPVYVQQAAYQDAEIKQGRPALTQAQSQRAYQPNTTAARAQEFSNDHQQGTESQEMVNRKFMKYTSEGYVPVNKSTKTGENLKWR